MLRILVVVVGVASRPAYIKNKDMFRIFNRIARTGIVVSQGPFDQRTSTHISRKCWILGCIYIT